jgi:hypothetical protein
VDAKAGFAPAPGARSHISAVIQTGMRDNDVQVSYKVASDVIRMAYHNIPIASMQSIGVTTYQIGVFTDKVGANDHLLSGSGPAIIELPDSLIACRELFDRGPMHTIDLHTLLAQVKRYKNQSIRVAAVWRAIQTQF